MLNIYPVNKGKTYTVLVQTTALRPIGRSYRVVEIKVKRSIFTVEAKQYQITSLQHASQF